MPGNEGVIRGLHMDHYVVVNNYENDHQLQLQHQHQPARMSSLLEPAQSDEYTEAMMIDGRRKSCARTTVDDVGYLCGCGASAVDDAEVVYVKRKNVTPRHTHNSNMMNYSDQREDASSTRYSNGFASARMNMGEYRDEGFEVNMEDFTYSSPRVGCMPAGVVDMLIPGGCRPEPKHFFHEERPNKGQAPKLNTLKEAKVVQEDEKKVGYDEWKKQMLDTVKVPSFNTNDCDAGVGSASKIRKEPDGACNSSSQCGRQHSQPRGTTEQSSVVSNDPPDYNAAAKSARHRTTENYQSKQWPHAQNNESYQITLEQQSLRRAREELQSELDALKRHTREIVKTASGMSHPDGSVGVPRQQMNYKEMAVNQKFNEIMSIASPRRSHSTNVGSCDMVNGRDYLSPRMSNSNWSDATSPIGMAHLPSSPGMNGSYMMNSPSAASAQGFLPSPNARTNIASSHHGLDVNRHGVMGSPASMMSGSDNHSFQPGLGENNKWMPRSPASSWVRGDGGKINGVMGSPASMMSGSDNNSFQPGLGENNKWIPTSTASGWIRGDEGKMNDDEELLNEMRMKSAMMEADLRRMKESMSPRFHTTRSHAPGLVMSQTGNGILRPSSYSSNNNIPSQYRGF